MDAMNFIRAQRMVLRRIGMYSPEAEALMFGTAAHESGGFQYIYQNGGPALGFYQMEPATLDDLYTNYLNDRSGRRNMLEGLRPGKFQAVEALEVCFAYQVGACRLHYARFREPLPSALDIEGQAKYYKEYWNTVAGKATEQDYIDAYERHYPHREIAKIPERVVVDEDDADLGQIISPSEEAV